GRAPGRAGDRGAASATVAGSSAGWTSGNGTLNSFLQRGQRTRLPANFSSAESMVPQEQGILIVMKTPRGLTSWEQTVAILSRGNNRRRAERRCLDGKVATCRPCCFVISAFR